MSTAIHRILQRYRALLVAGLLCTQWVCPAQTSSRLEAPEFKAFLKQYCFDCHDSASAKGHLNLESLPSNPGNREVLDRWVRVFDRVQDGEMPPEKKPQPGSAERQQALATLKSALVDADRHRQASVGRTTLRRLNRTEYEYTLRDLLSLPSLELADRLPADAELDGFDTVGAALNTSPVQLARYLETAELALREAMALGPEPKARSRRIAAAEFKLWTNAYGQAQVSGTNVVFLRQGPDHPWPVPSLAIRVSGMYRIRLRGFGTYWNDGQLEKADRPQVGRLHCGPRVVATFDLSDGTPREMEFRFWANRGENLVLEWPMLDARLAMVHLRRQGKPYRGPGVALDLVETEGPLYPEWPPPGYHALFDQLRWESWNPRGRMERPEPLANPTAPHASQRFAVVPKNPSTDARRLLRRFMEQAFRRPVAPGEEEPFVALVAPRLRETVPYQEALLPGYQAVLCSPDFLFLRESPGPLDNWELASRLSYFLWRSAPDAELRSVAASGRLQDPVVLRAQADRLLADPKARRFTESFLDGWLDLRKIGFTQPDAKLYPDFDGWLQDSMMEESRLYFEELLHQDLGVSGFVKSDFTFLNQRLAGLYGIPGITGVALRKVTLPPDCPRGGFLSQASVLKVTANGSTTSPVTRGAWVRNRLLGQPVPPPPPTAGTIDPDTRGTTTIREQLEKHRRDPSCAGCHAKMDPPGFALERFDVRGGWRDRYRSLESGDTVDLKINNQPVAYKLGRPVDASGVTEEGQPFRDFLEFRDLLSRQTDALARSFVERLVVFATGAPIQFADHDEIAAILERARSKSADPGVRSLLNEVLQSPLFLNK